MGVCDFGLINGQIMPIDDIKVSPFDRGYLFGDAVYEVVPIFNGQLFHLEQHLDRLASSLDAIGFSIPQVKETFKADIKKLMQANSFDESGSVYLQISRGLSKPRLHDFSQDTSPTCFAYLSTSSTTPFDEIKQGGDAILLEDTRWGRCDIKSTNLLANCLAKEEARQRGAFEAILFRNGFITEASASTVFTVIDNELVTTPLSPNILPGITRNLILDLAKSHDIAVSERAFTVKEIITAKEVFISSSTKDLFPIVKIDEHQIGDGVGGKVWEKLYHAYQTIK